MSRLTADRRAAGKVVQRFLERPGRVDHWLLDASRGLRDTERRRARALVYAMLRNRILLEAWLAPWLKKPMHRQALGAQVALLLGATELILMDGVPDRAAVDQGVELARAFGAPRQSGFVNAVLRRLASREAPPEIPDRETDPLGWAHLACSHPLWMLDRLAALYGPEGAAAHAEAANTEPPTVLAFRSAADRDTFAPQLHGAPGRLIPAALRLPPGAGRVDTLPGFSEGAFWVQDEGAQAAAALLDVQPGDVVLDACAAPGGKALHAAAAAGPDGAVGAVDLDARRLERLRANIERTGLDTIEPMVADLLGEPVLEEPVDRVLLDAPCSGLGVLRRHPDARSARQPSDLKRYADRQAALLDAVAPAVRPGGRLVYVVCTFTSEETDAVIDRFLAAPAGADFSRVDARQILPDLPADAVIDGALRTAPHLHGADAFYAVALDRRP